MGNYFIKDGYQHGTVNTTVVEEAEDYWNPTRQLYSRHTQFPVYRLAGELAKREKLKSVLDVGCGLGHKLMEAVAPVAPVAETTGVDQPSVVEAARKLFPQGNFVAADFEKPDETGLGTFDLLICADVIEHMADPDLLLTFLHAHCHDGSFVLISTPERDVRRGVDNMQSPKAEHVREWNRSELRQYLESRGFEIVEQTLLPAFRVGRSWRMFKERLRMLRKRIPFRYNQVVVARSRSKRVNS